MLFNYLGEDLRSRRPNQAARKKPIETYFHLPYLTRLAFVAGDLPKAKSYAEQALSERIRYFPSAYALDPTCLPCSPKYWGGFFCAKAT
jgi:hypothetical protein